MKRRARRPRLTLRLLATMGLSLFGACDRGAADLAPEIGELREPDQDRNGLQDDVDAFIREHAENEDERLILEMYAHNDQDGLEWSKDEARSLELAHDEAPQECLYVVFGFEEGEVLRSEMFALTVDSEARTEAFLRWESHLGGEFFPSVHFSRSECLAKSREARP